MRQPGFVVSAMQSGSGKTVLTCGLLCALRKRGLEVRAFKCGPDYIDPMFHERVVGVPSRNLDLFLQGEKGVRRTFARAMDGAGVAVVEGAMGLYDGVGGTDEASAWAVARTLGLPVVLAVRPRGASLTLAAQVRGVMAFRAAPCLGDSGDCPGGAGQVTAVVLTDCKPSLAAHLTPLLERETGLPVLGYLPPMEEARFESRHLGLMTAAEVRDCGERLEAVGAQVERTVDVERLLGIASQAVGIGCAAVAGGSGGSVRIAVAYDEAFCFYYADNLDALAEAGAEVVRFSPLHDGGLPEGICGLYLGGGYPELHARELAANASMLAAVGEAVRAGMPTVAECGGFLYLQRSLEDASGASWPMVGALPGAGVATDRLQRFGYAHLEAEEPGMLVRPGESVPVHEFHYWDCTENGSAFVAHKPGSARSWSCGYAGPTLYAAFGHLHFGGALPLAVRFVDAARAWGAAGGA